LEFGESFGVRGRRWFLLGAAGDVTAGISHAAAASVVLVFRDDALDPKSKYLIKVAGRECPENSINVCSSVPAKARVCKAPLRRLLDSIDSDPDTCRALSIISAWPLSLAERVGKGNRNSPGRFDASRVFTSFAHAGDIVVATV
jgi:hypothetical protein